MTYLENFSSKKDLSFKAQEIKIKFSFFFRNFLREIGSVHPAVVEFVAKTDLMNIVKKIILNSVVINASFNVRVFVLLSFIFWGMFNFY